MGNSAKSAPDNTETKQVDHSQEKTSKNPGKILGANLFQKGQSGNPAGRPKGSRNKETLAAEILLDGEGVNITRKAIELALGGDITAIKYCLDRILPARKGRLINISLPALKSPKDSTRVMAAILKASTSGEITTSEAEGLSNIVMNYNKCYETQEFNERITRLEVHNDYEAEL